jgi:hypothetical protein
MVEHIVQFCLHFLLLLWVEQHCGYEIGQGGCSLHRLVSYDLLVQQVWIGYTLSTPARVQSLFNGIIRESVKDLPLYIIPNASRATSTFSFASKYCRATLGPAIPSF